MAKKQSKKSTKAKHVQRPRITHTLYLHIAEKDGRGIIDEIYLPSNGDGSTASESMNLHEMIENAMMFNRVKERDSRESSNHIVVALPLDFELPEEWVIRVPVPVIGSCGGVPAGGGGSEPVQLLGPRG